MLKSIKGSFKTHQDTCVIAEDKLKIHLRTCTNQETITREQGTDLMIGIEARVNLIIRIRTKRIRISLFKEARSMDSRI